MGSVTFVGPSPNQCSTSNTKHLRLALKLFRGEPAISGFVWHFTPIHSSSHSFSTLTWFGPPRTLTCASPWPWIDHPVSGLRQITIRPVQTRFRYGSGPSALNLATYRNSPVHSAIGTPSASYGPRTACRHTVSGSISLPSRGAFHLSLTVLVRYRSPRVFSLGRWSSQIPTGFLVSRGTRGRSAKSSAFRLQDYYLLWWTFPGRFT
jgi:hypothetical protein